MEIYVYANSYTFQVKLASSAKLYLVIFLSVSLYNISVLSTGYMADWKLLADQNILFKLKQNFKGPFFKIPVQL